MCVTLKTVLINHVSNYSSRSAGKRKRRRHSFNKFMAVAVLFQSISEVRQRAILLQMNKALIEIVGNLAIRLQVATAAE